ncbi:MAG: hypothetical protein DDT38_01484 [Firmicutes bacterium]|nr:hypothetical protein [candidate division NPL-UPA2 bacterium]
MNTLIVTAADILADGFYREHDMISDGDIWINPYIEVMRVRGSVRAAGLIEFGWGTSIVAGGIVEAGTAGFSEIVESGGSVEAGANLTTGGIITAYYC